MKKQKFIVEIEIPEGANVTDMKHYILDAVSSMCSALDSFYDPLFGIDYNTIKVVHVTRAKASKLLEELKNEKL